MSMKVGEWSWKITKNEEILKEHYGNMVKDEFYINISYHIEL